MIVIHIIIAMCDCATDRGGEPERRPPESHLGQSEERDGRRNTQTGDKIQSNTRRGPYSGAAETESALIFIGEFL